MIEETRTMDLPEGYGLDFGAGVLRRPGGSAIAPINDDTPGGVMLEIAWTDALLEEEKAERREQLYYGPSPRQLLDEVLEDSFLPRLVKEQFRDDLGLAMIAVAVQVDVGASPPEVFERALGAAKVIAPVRAAYRWRFKRSLDPHMAELNREVGGEYVEGQETI